MKRLLSACALLLLLGAGCLGTSPEPVTSEPPPPITKPIPIPPPTEEPAPTPVPEPPGTTADGCRRTGCSGQLCADEEMVSTCEYREEYACYKDAKCERQADGACGWTMDAALTACLQSKSQAE